MAQQITNNSLKKNYLKNEYMEMWLENGIVHGVYLPNTVVTLEAAKKCVEDRLIVTKGINYPSLVDVQNISGEEKAAREYYSSAEGVRNLIAGAFIVKTYLPALLVNIYLKLNKPRVPARLFIHRENALVWLEPFKNQIN